MRMQTVRLLCVTALVATFALASGCNPSGTHVRSLSAVYDAAWIWAGSRDATAPASLDPTQTASAIAPAYLSRPGQGLYVLEPGGFPGGTWSAPQWPKRDVEARTWSVERVLPLASTTVGQKGDLLVSDPGRAKAYVGILRGTRNGNADGFAAFGFTRVGSTWRYSTASSLLLVPESMSVLSKASARAGDAARYQVLPTGSATTTWLLVYPVAGQPYALVAKMTKPDTIAGSDIHPGQAYSLSQIGLSR